MIQTIKRITGGFFRHPLLVATILFFMPVRVVGGRGYEEVFHLFHEGRFLEAIQLSKENLKTSHPPPQDIYYLLAYSHNQLREKGLSYYYLMKSLTIETNPLKLFRGMVLLHKINPFTQGELSMSPLMRLRYYFYFLAEKNILVISASIGCWLFFLSIFFYSINVRNFNRRYQPLLLLTGSLILLVTLCLYLNKKFFIQPGIVLNSLSPITLYKSPGDSEILLQVESGVIVNSDKEKEAFVRINEPVFAWVKRENVCLFDKPESTTFTNGSACP